MASSSNPLGDGPGASPSKGSGGVQNVRLVAWLMIAQGVLEGMLAFCFAIWAVLQYFVIAQPGRGELPNEGFMPILTLLGMAAVLIPSILHIWAGILNLSFQAHTFGIIALFSGLLSSVSVFCAPTGLALLVLGLIVYLQSDTREAFQQAEAGKSPEAILKMFQR